MDWIVTILLSAAAIYAIVAYYIYRKKLWQDHVTFYGPILAVRSRKVGFFDRFARCHAFLRIYGTIGAVIVILVSVAMVALLLFSLHYNIVQQPPPTAVNELRNVLAIPGVNEFIPFTFAVWFSFVLTLVVHEFGHAFLARVERIRVKFIGVLFFIIPVGAFVEPDEEEYERTKGMSKIRMLGAGITNNIVVGFICFGLLFLVLGNAAPVDVPLVKAVYNEYPAAYAGVPPNSIIRSINGIDVATRDDVAAILNRSRPGEQVTLVTEKDHQRSAYLLTLARWPDAAGERTGGFMGVSYYDAPSVKRVFDNLATPFGFFFLMAIPIEIILNPVGWQHFMILINDTTDAVAWSVPFPQYWLIVQILFWCAWFNISVGLCNALPMIPLDGGYILKEGVDRLLDCRGILKYSGYVVTVVSYAMLMILVLLFTLPYLFRAAGMS